jgi:hypothetical protein
LYWYYYGGLGSTAGNMEKAKKIWWTSLILQVLVTIVLLLVLVLLNLAEGILTTDWLIILGLISIHTWILFWFCTFFMSPRTVKNLPLFT